LSILSEEEEEEDTGTSSTKRKLDNILPFPRPENFKTEAGFDKWEENKNNRDAIRAVWTLAIDAKKSYNKELSEHFKEIFQSGLLFYMRRYFKGNTAQRLFWCLERRQFVICGIGIPNHIMHQFTVSRESNDEQKKKQLESSEKLLKAHFRVLEYFTSLRVSLGIPVYISINMFFLHNDPRQWIDANGWMWDGYLVDTHLSKPQTLMRDGYVVDSYLSEPQTLMTCTERENAILQFYDVADYDQLSKEEKMAFKKTTNFMEDNSSKRSPLLRRETDTSIATREQVASTGKNYIPKDCATTRIYENAEQARRQHSAKPPSTPP
jgi:hypothetical protein